MFSRDPSTAALTLAVSGRLRRLQARFAALVERVEAGTLPPARDRRGAAREADRGGAADAQRLGWLCRLMPEGKVQASYLEEQVLPDSRLARVLDATPRAGGMLRTVLWMAGREAPEGLRLPPRPPRAKVVPLEPVVVPSMP